VRLEPGSFDFAGEVSGFWQCQPACVNRNAFTNIPIRYDSARREYRRTGKQADRPIDFLGLKA
jgi:hypothetical protein